MDATSALEAHAAGQQDAAAQLVPHVYEQLRLVARSYMRHERTEHSLQPSDLVHEAFLRLVDSSRISWQGKTHFFAMAARQMRYILVEHARSRAARKRGAGAAHLPLRESILPTTGKPLDVLALHEALNRLAEFSPRQSQVVELRFFGGLTIREASYVLGVSIETVKLDWRMARVWLLRELSTANPSD